MTYQEMSYCVFLLSASFALLSLGLLFIRTSGLLKEVTLILTLIEPTISKINLILDDVNRKLSLLDAPVELFSHVFSHGSLKKGMASLVSLAFAKIKKR